MSLIKVLKVDGNMVFWLIGMHGILRVMSGLGSLVNYKLMSMVPDTDTFDICMMMQSVPISLDDAPICAVHIHPHSCCLSLFWNNNLLPFNLYLSAYSRSMCLLKGQSVWMVVLLWSTYIFIYFSLSFIFIQGPNSPYTRCTSWFWQESLGVLGPWCRFMAFIENHQ